MHHHFILNILFYLFTKEVRVTSNKSELCPHYKNTASSVADSQIITAVLTELFLFCTAHGAVELYITVFACFVQRFFFPLSLHSQLALFPTARVESRALVRWRR